MNPQLIYFLADASDFPDPRGTIELCKTLNPAKRVNIMAIAFDNHEGEDILKQTASDSGGQYKFISAADLHK